ncbi:MAG: molecular chaperone DnaK [Bradymonadales bacterium]|nr:MAG: molecular chaperone DnaK [Bradymonadales bacterium]
MAKVVGIDFGTSNSAVSCVVDGETHILPDENGNRLTPSVVSFGKDQRILIGQAAKEQAFKNPKRTIHSIKRLIGRKFYSLEIEKAKALLPFDLVEVDGKNVGVQVDNSVYSPQEIAALILKKMKTIADSALGEDIVKAVVTVPAYFNDNQRQTTKEACELAGLDPIRMINEPTAAALAYGFGKSLNQNIVIYDLGGGTFDLSILRLRGDVFEVVGTAGDTFLGGDDFDDRLIDLIASKFLKTHGVDLRSIPAALPILRLQAEKTKKRLSYSQRTDLFISKIIQKDDESIDLHMTLSQDQLKDSCQDLIQRTFSVCDEALSAARLKASEIDEVILVGGPTKMPVIVDAVQSYFGRQPLNDLNPDEVVSMGAAIQAHSLSSDSAEKRSLLLDVTPLDLGVATVGGYTETLISKNSPIPAEAKQVFTTTSDGQKSVDIRIFQGKGRRVESSTPLGEFSLSGFEPGKAGSVEIEVRFSINTDGIMSVSAIEKKTGVSQNISVKMGSLLAEQERQAKTTKAKLNEVQIKDEWSEFEKVLIQLPSRSGLGSTYKEGFMKKFDPESKSLEIFSEDKSGQSIEIDPSVVGWIALIDDFSNIPRYIRSLYKKPKPGAKAGKFQLYEFRMKNRECFYAEADLPKLREKGFWVTAHSPLDPLKGRIFVYSDKLESANPLNQTEKGVASA